MQLRVDEKGRLQIPEKIRREAGIGGTVKVKVTEAGILIEPSEDPLGRLSGMVEFGFRSVRESLPSLRKATERQFATERTPAGLPRRGLSRQT